MSTLRKASKLFISISFFCQLIRFGNGSPAVVSRQTTSDFGGDFSAGSLSGAEAPGPSAGTMGNKAASAMGIGTGGMGPGDYTSSYKTPNYTQYTQQDFKEFMPNYQDMMSNSLGAGKSSFGNFSQVNDMLKGFIDLQKEQLQVEKAKAEADKAKLDLALDYDFDDSVKPPDAAITMTDKASRRSKRSPTSSYVSTSATYQMSPSKMMINSMLPPSKIQYPSQPAAPMQIESFGLLDSSSSASPPNQFIISSTSLPGSKTEEKSTVNEKEKILENVIAMLLDYAQKKKPVGDEALKQSDKYSPTSTNSISKIPIVGSRLNDLGFHDSLVNFGGKMIEKLQPRLVRQSSPGGGGWDSSASKWMGGGSSWPSGSSAQQGSGKSRQTSATITPSTSSTMPPQPSSGGGPPPSFWEKFSSMFGTAGQSPPTSGSGSQSSSQSSNDQKPTDPQFPSLVPQQTGSAQASPPNWVYSPPPASRSDTTTSGCSPEASLQSNQGKRGLGDYGPIHGGVSLSNIPYTESNMPFKSSIDNGLPAATVGENSNIPSMSFSMNPQPPPVSSPSPSYIEPNRKIPAQVVPEPEIGYFLSKRPSTTTKFQMKYPSGLEMPAPLEQQQYMYVDTVPPPAIKNDRMFYVVDPIKNTGGYVTVSEQVQPPLNLYRLSREEKTIEDEPVLLYAINKNGKTGKQIKKVLLDPENGLVITQTNDEASISELSSSRRRKRSTENKISNSKTDERDKEKDENNTNEKLSDDPNGHSHRKNDQMDLTELYHDSFFDGSDLKRDDYHGQALGESVDYDYDRVKVQDAVKERNDKLKKIGAEKRSVKIDLTQKTGSLPDGTIETISAGGGRSPGHHEGGGLTVEVTKEDEAEQTKRDVQERKKQERKTLNFFFTW